MVAPVRVSDHNQNIEIHPEDSFEDTVGSAHIAAYMFRPQMSWGLIEYLHHSTHTGVIKFIDRVP